MKVDVSVIIVNYNGETLIGNCLASVYKHTQDVAFEIIVVDNASSDASVSIIKNFYPQVRLIQSTVNRGFGQANNMGVERASGKYILLLNSDTILLNNAIKVFYHFMEKTTIEKVGAIGGELLSPSGEIIHSYESFPSMFTTWIVTLRHNLLRFSPIRKLRGFLKKKRKPMQPISKPIYVDYITGADLFMPKEVFVKFNGFNPAFFMYAEEADLQKRMANEGFKRLIIPGTQIVHLEGATSNKKKKIKNAQYYASLNKYFQIHNSRISYLFFRICFFLLPKVPM